MNRAAFLLVVFVLILFACYYVGVAIGTAARLALGVL